MALLVSFLLVVGAVSSSQQGVLPTEPNDKYSPPLEIQLMQLNTWLIPVRPGGYPFSFDYSVKDRAARLEDWIHFHIQRKQLNVLLLQEVWTPGRSVVAGYINRALGGNMFGRSFIESVLDKNNFWYTKVKGCEAVPCSRLFDSGLLIASRFPFLLDFFWMYPPGKGDEAYSSKGVMIVALNVSGVGSEGRRALIVATTHLDANADDGPRLMQIDIALQNISEFVEIFRMVFPEFEVVGTVFGGDFNIAGHNYVPYTGMKSRMETAGLVDSWVMQEGVEAREDPLGITSLDLQLKKQRLDYVWVTPNNVARMTTTVSDRSEWNQVDDAFVESMQNEFMSREDKRVLIENRDLQNRASLISDHAALFTNITFASTV